MLSTALQVYVGGYLAACVAALLLLWRDRGAHAVTQRGYWRQLAQPWRLATFVLATVLLAAAAPMSGDPTWDVPDAVGMAVLTFVTAPWTVGTLFLWIRRRARLAQAFVAASAWMLSASWSYDLYILWRDRVYPAAWRDNIAASSILYLTAGLLWSLDWRQGRGVHLAFTEPGWPTAAPQGGVFTRVLPWALVLMVLVSAAMVVAILWG